MTNHSPFPWVRAGDHPADFVLDANQDIVAFQHLTLVRRLGRDRAAANTALVLAIPDMVAALRLMLSHGERCNWFAGRGDEEVCDYARAALAKAGLS